MTSRPTIDHPAHARRGPRPAAGSPSASPPDELSVARERIANLEEALRTSRVIGTAVGIIVERHKVTAEAAFALLVAASRSRNRKLHDVAADLVETGALPDDSA